MAARVVLNNSSIITSFQYDDTTQTLEVVFKKGSIYHYPNVRPEMYQQFVNSQSKGQFLHQFLRSQSVHTPVRKDEGEKGSSHPRPGESRPPLHKGKGHGRK